MSEWLKRCDQLIQSNYRPTGLYRPQRLKKRRLRYNFTSFGVLLFTVVKGVYSFCAKKDETGFRARDRGSIRVTRLWLGLMLGIGLVVGQYGLSSRQWPVLITPDGLPKGRLYDTSYLNSSS